MAVRQRQNASRDTRKTLTSSIASRSQPDDRVRQSPVGGASQSAPTRWRVLDLVLDTKRQRVWRGSLEIPMPKLTYELFVTLVRRCAEVTSDEQLMQDVWPGLFVGPETVSQRVKLLRDALGDDSRMPRYIGRLRGRGYHLVPTALPFNDEMAAPSPSVPIASTSAREPHSSHGEVADRPPMALSLLEPDSEPQHPTKPDWASTHVFANEFFVSLLESPAVPAALGKMSPVPLLSADSDESQD